jgi:hypothetical protein
MKNDRNYFRKLLSYELIDAARYGDNELAIVLAERLDVLLDAQDQLYEAKAEIKELNARLDIWQAEAVELQRQFDATKDAGCIW